MKYLIVGLGNIGSEYTNTRHNIGFKILDEFVSTLDTSFNIERLASVCTTKVKGRTLILIKPSTYMNLSGKAVKYWMDKEKVAFENILIIADDIALPTGKLRLRKNGSSGGHNGLENIISTLGRKDFNRLRFGIGDNFPRGRQVDYVLGEWTNDDLDIVEPKVVESCSIIKTFVSIGMDRTMNQYNK